MRPDPFDLSRFTAAQARVYSVALEELRAGLKVSHWMWFIFPQFEGLGRSGTSRRYAIRSEDEARAYLEHPVLGPRLVECSDALLGHEGRSASAIFGSPDDMKLRSSMTLFELVAPPESVFARVLDRYFASERDPITLDLVRARK